MLARSWSPLLFCSSPRLALGAALGLGLLLGAVVVVGSPLAALAALLGVALGLAILRRPVVGLYALVGLVLLLPFAVIPARLGLQLTALEVLLGLTLGTTVLTALARRERLRIGPLGCLFVGLIGLAVLAFLLSLPYTGGADVVRRFLKLMLAMLVFPLTLRLVRQGVCLDGLLVTIMLCGALEAVIAIGLYRLPPETTVRLLSTLGPLGYPTGPEVLRFLPGENDTYSDVLRATGSAIDPNVLGGALMLAAALQLTQLFAPRPCMPRWVLLPGGAATVLAMLLTHSRGSWVGLALALLAVATVRFRRIWLALIPAALAIALLPAGRALYARVLSGFAAQDKAAAMRLDEYRNALAIIDRHPLLGIGFGGPPAIDLAPGVSSIYLTLAETMGLVALALFLALLAWLLGRSVRALLRADDPVLQSRLAGLSTAVLAALIAGLFDHYFASTAFPHMVALFWLCCGLLYQASQVPGPRSDFGRGTWDLGPGTGERDD
jgi:O-antigen ligase